MQEKVFSFNFSTFWYFLCFPLIFFLFFSFLGVLIRWEALDSSPYSPCHLLPLVSIIIFLSIIIDIDLPPPIFLRYFFSHIFLKKKDADLLPALLVPTTHQSLPSSSSPSSPASALPFDLPQVFSFTQISKKEKEMKRKRRKKEKSWSI